MMLGAGKAATIGRIEFKGAIWSALASAGSCRKPCLTLM